MQHGFFRISLTKYDFKRYVWIKTSNGILAFVTTPLHPKIFPLKPKPQKIEKDKLPLTFAPSQRK
jgi:hypothetical protein